MGGPSKVRVGGQLTEFPGRSFNQLVAGHYRFQAALAGNTKSQSGAGQILTVKAKNVTGADLAYGHCVALESLAIPYVDKDKQAYGRPLVKANKNTSALHHAILGVALKPTKNNKPGPFIYSGPAWLRCDYTSLSHHFVRLKSDQVTFTELAESATSGSPIIDRELTVTGEQWVLALLGVGSGGTELLTGKLINSIPARDWLEDCVVLETWDSMTNSWTEGETIAGINQSFQNIRGSEALPVAVVGIPRTLTVTVEMEEVSITAMQIMPFDPSILPGSVETTPDGEPQGIYHLSASRQWTADGGPCQFEAEV